MQKNYNSFLILLKTGEKSFLCMKYWQSPTLLRIIQTVMMIVLAKGTNNQDNLRVSIARVQEHQAKICMKVKHNKMSVNPYKRM